MRERSMRTRPWFGAWAICALIASIAESTRPGIFDEAAVSALSRWRYKPKIENGQPVERPGVKTKITFVLED